MCAPGRLVFCLCTAIFISFLLCCSPASTISSFKHICTFLTSAFSTLAWLLLKGSAYLVVFLLEALQVLTQSLHGGMYCVANGIRGLAWSLLDKALKVAASAASMLIDFLKEQSPKVASAAYSAFNFVMEQIKGLIECLQKIVPEIMENLVDMLVKVLEALWTNYLEAVKCVAEKGK